MSEQYPDGAPVAALEHLARLIAKRDTLQAAIDSAAWQLVSEGSRIGDNPLAALTLHEAIRAARASDTLSGSHAELAEETGYSVGRLRAMQKAGQLRGVDDSPYYSGCFPLGGERAPGKGVPCVYALFDVDGELVYIGQTQNARARLKNHWALKKELNLARWALSIVREGEDRLAVELALIRNFKPRGNKAGVS